LLSPHPFEFSVDDGNEVVFFPIDSSQFVDKEAK
jgi:hypothetical protein